MTQGISPLLRDSLIILNYGAFVACNIVTEIADGYYYRSTKLQTCHYTIKLILSGIHFLTHAPQTDFYVHVMKQLVLRVVAYCCLPLFIEYEWCLQHD